MQLNKNNSYNLKTIKQEYLTKINICESKSKEYRELINEINKNIITNFDYILNSVSEEVLLKLEDIINDTSLSLNKNNCRVISINNKNINKYELSIVNEIEEESELIHCSPYEILNNLNANISKNESISNLSKKLSILKVNNDNNLKKNTSYSFELSDNVKECSINNNNNNIKNKSSPNLNKKESNLNDNNILSNLLNNKINELNLTYDNADNNVNIKDEQQAKKLLLKNKNNNDLTNNSNNLEKFSKIRSHIIELFNEFYLSLEFISKAYYIILNKKSIIFGLQQAYEDKLWIIREDKDNFIENCEVIEKLIIEKNEMIKKLINNYSILVTNLLRKFKNFSNYKIANVFIANPSLKIIEYFNELCMLDLSMTKLEQNIDIKKNDKENLVKQYNNMKLKMNIPDSYIGNSSIKYVGKNIIINYKNGSEPKIKESIPNYNINYSDDISSIDSSNNCKSIENIQFPSLLNEYKQSYRQTNRRNSDPNEISYLSQRFKKEYIKNINTKDNINCNNNILALHKTNLNIPNIIDYSKHDLTIIPIKTSKIKNEKTFDINEEEKAKKKLKLKDLKERSNKLLNIIKYKTKLIEEQRRKNRKAQSKLYTLNQSIKIADIKIVKLEKNIKDNNALCLNSNC